MASGQVQHAAQSFGADGTATALRLGRDGSVITRDFVTQLALEGKLFVAGTGIEGTAMTGRTSLDEQTPDLMLKSPAGGNVRIMPLHFEALVSAEGGAAPDWYINAVTANIGITTAGTTITPQSLGVVGKTSAAIIQTVPTLAAYTNTDNTLLRNAQNALDNYISVEQVTKAAGTKQDNYMNDGTRILWTPSWPLVLGGGQMWCFYGVAGTTGQDFEWTLVYAEIDAGAHF